MQLCVNPLSLLSSPYYPILFILANPSFHLLGEPASLARGANIHPLLSIPIQKMKKTCFLRRVITWSKIKNCPILILFTLFRIRISKGTTFVL
jgi:hypothetical protein